MKIIFTLLAIISGPVFLFSGFWFVLKWRTSLRSDNFSFKSVLKPLILFIFSLFSAFFFSYLTLQ